MGNLFHDDISTNNIIRGYKIISDYANANDKILLGDGSYITISSLTESLIQRSELDDYVKYVTYSNFTNNIINGTTIIGQSLTASVLKNKRKISLDGVSTSGVVYFDGTTDVTIDITNIDANLIGTGTIDRNRLPKGALERLVIVNTETDKFALTSDSVQRGDSVKVLSDGLMYIVIDDTQLSSALGYMTYSAGTSLNSEQLGGVVASEYALKSGVVNYANYSGVATQSYYSGTSSYSTKSLKDGNGNTISTTYLPLTGGIVNGTITASKFVNYTYRDNDYILLSNGGVLSTASFAADNHKHDFHTDILNIITASNNFDFIPNNYNNKLNINYKSINEINDATISSYDFYNGRGIYTLLNASGFVIPSLTNNQNYYLKANGSYGLITDLSYTLPTATSTTLGGVKIGSGVTISSGVISVTQGSIGLGNVNNTADANKSVNYATSAGNADTVDGLHASSFATSGHNHDSIYVLKTGDTMTGGLKVNGNLTASGFIIPNGTSTQLLTAGGGVLATSSFAVVNHKHDFHTDINNIIMYGNEFNFIPTNFNNYIVFNYRDITGTTNATISQYCFYNGRNGFAPILTSGYYINGLDNNSLVLAGGGHISTSSFATSTQGTKADSAIQGIMKNNVLITPSSNIVNISIPIATSEITNDSDFITSATVDNKIASAISSVYKAKGNIASKTALLALTNVKRGDVYNYSGSATFSLVNQTVKNGDNIVCLDDASTSVESNWDNLGGNIDLSAYAKLNSPSFDGTPTSTTPTTSDNSTQIATTAFVKNQGYLTSYTDTKNTTGTNQSNAKLYIVGATSQTDYIITNTNINVYIDNNSKLTANGFKIPGDNNSSQLLTADGGSVSMSSFATSGHNHDSIYVLKAGDTMTG